MQPCHGAPPHQSAAGSSHFRVPYSGPPCAAAQPCHLQVPPQFMGTAYRQPFTGSSWHTAALYGQPWTTPMQFQGCSGCRPTAEPEQKRELNPAYCLIDEDGTLKPFSSASQMSGRSHENMISKIFDSGGPRTLRAVEHQNTQERERLEKNREAVALLLQKTVSDHAGHAMMKKGVAEERAEVDTVFIGCFEDFAKRTSTFCNATVSATCAEVQHVLVEICSDSRFVAMKLYQIELQSCLVARQGYLVDEANLLPRQQLTAQTTGFAIIFNRAALQMETQELAKKFRLINVCQLLQDGKLHIAYFQPEAALPGALSIARDADQKARDADQKASDADQKARDADQKARDADQKASDADQKARDADQKASDADQKARDADQKASDADQKARDADQKASDADQKARDADQKASEARQKVRELEDKLEGDGPFSVSSLCFSDCFVGMSFKCIFFATKLRIHAAFNIMN